jgi:hypothetical protein
MAISLKTNKPMWQVVSDLVKAGLLCNRDELRPKRSKVNKYQHFSRAKKHRKRPSQSEEQA